MVDAANSARFNRTSCWRSQGSPGGAHAASACVRAGLLSLDPSSDPSSLLASLTMGTEVEVQFGKSLQARRPAAALPCRVPAPLQAGCDAKHEAGLWGAQAAMARKLRDSDIATQWTLNYQLTSRLRMQFTLASASPYPRTLLCQYSTGETPPPPMPR
jgi:hypothetical protein